MSNLLTRLRAMPSSLNDACRTMDEAAARIDALEAALHFILVDPPAALDEPDTDAEIIRHYREVARAALDKDVNK